MDSNVRDALSAGTKFGFMNVWAKELTRLIFPWDQIQNSCNTHVNSDFFCQLVSSNSAPNFVQAFVFTLGVAEVADALFRDRVSPKLIPSISAGITFGLCILAEAGQASFRKSTLDIPDLITETAGAALAWGIIALWPLEGT